MTMETDYVICNTVVVIRLHKRLYFQRLMSRFRRLLAVEKFTLEKPDFLIY
jgi:hypothetical protein